MEGVLLINKPKGPSSFQVVKKVRALCGIKKVGHAGTLDPMASGLLVVCLGRYTKLASLLMHGHKTYRAVFRLGETTASDDQESPVIERRSIEHLGTQDINQALLGFLGSIEQIPPKYSAVKVNGQRAYDLARADRDPKLLPRPVEVFDLAIEKWELPDITVRIHCSKGTYVRALARDLGTILGVGAHACEIERMSSGQFSVHEAVSFRDLNKDAVLVNLRSGFKAVLGLETVQLTETDKNNAIHGREILEHFDLPSGEALAFFGGAPIVVLKRGLNGVKIARVL